jgi:transporter family protein
LLIGLTLTLADFIYFLALSQQGALISIISTVRRSGVIVSFTLGAFIFKEHRIKEKAIILAGILAGILLIAVSSK